MATVELQFEGASATLNYEETESRGPVEFQLTTDSEELRNVVTRYFNKKREFWIPESQKIDDYRIDKDVVPTKEFVYFELALMELKGETDINVIWPDDPEALAKIEV